MRPTPGEQLGDLRRLIDIIGAETGLSEQAATALADARRVLRRLEGSWDDVAPFLRRDNARLVELFDQLGVVPARAPDDDGRFATIEAHNNELRAQLSGFVAAGSLDERSRAAVATYLRDRLAHDPTQRSNR